MYTLVRAYGVRNALNSLWQDHDVSTFKLFEIYQLFRDIYIELESPFVVGEIYVHLKALEFDYSGSQLTLAELFTANPNLSLPTVPAIPTFDQKRIRYMDAFRSGYKLDISAPGHRPDSNVSDVTKTELLIKRAATSTRDLHEFCLFTVNGYLHPTDHDTEFLYVLDGGKSLKKSRRNTCGITSFERIGRVHQSQITDAQISAVNPQTPLSRQLFITIPEQFRNMSVMLSLGGYLVTPEANVFVRISDDLWVVNLEQLDMVGRFFESSKYLDFSSLELTDFSEDKDKVSLIELLTDEVVRKYMTLIQSFIIAVEVPVLNYVKHYVRHSQIANEYITYSNPTCPLFLGRGRQADYWKQQDEGRWSITVENGYRPNLIYDDIDNFSNPFDSGASTPYNIYENSRAFLLDIIADIQTS